MGEDTLIGEQATATMGDGDISMGEQVAATIGERDLPYGGADSCHHR